MTVTVTVVVVVVVAVGCGPWWPPGDRHHARGAHRFRSRWASAGRGCCGCCSCAGRYDDGEDGPTEATSSKDVRSRRRAGCCDGKKHLHRTGRRRRIEDALLARRPDLSHLIAAPAPALQTIQPVRGAGAANGSAAEGDSADWKLYTAQARCQTAAQGTKELPPPARLFMAHGPPQRQRRHDSEEAMVVELTGQCYERLPDTDRGLPQQRRQRKQR